MIIKIDTAKVTEAMAAEARTIRNERLKESDVEILRNYLAENLPVPQTWRKYRQDLRDLPSQTAFPNTILWPNKPSI